MCRRMVHLFFFSFLKISHKGIAPIRKTIARKRRIPAIMMLLYKQG
jgi:hypothetical protein